ncbi:YobI family P-loop NTPase [Pseudomonas asplenii]
MEARKALGKLKRYLKAAVKAYEAAQAFLAVPKGENLFVPLTPVVLDQQQFNRYERELLHGLSNEQVRNIAITGEYGAGKSSVIRTFVERHPEFTYAFVSLAAFGKDASGSAPAAGQALSEEGFVSDSNDTGVPGKTESDSKTDPDILARIEETIVQQLLYSVPAKRLPKTRLKRITQAPTLNIWFKTVCYGVLILAWLRLYAPAEEKLSKHVPAWLLDGLLQIPDYLAVIAATLGGTYFLYAALRLISLFSIDGFTLKGGKLETTHHGSVLHKSIDEIIYCFERSSIDVVVIEDLDRFGIHDVFTRLREINFIIKQSPQVRRPVYFIYALRDEMFAVGEKTKFFDLIVPVIPVINSDNSQEKMLELLRGRNFKEKTLGSYLDRRLVETVCYYISDMRLIKNIVNEFDIFSNTLAKSLPLDLNKLFAIVAIRNLHPREYADLVKRCGPIYDVIQGLDVWKTQKAHTYEKQIQALRKLKEERQEEVASNIEELRAHVWFSLLKATGGEVVTHVEAGDHGFTALEFLIDEKFNQVFSEDVDLRTYLSDSFGDKEYSESSVRSSSFLALTGYERRLMALELSVEKILKEIVVLQSELSSISKMSFSLAARQGYIDVFRDQLPGLDVVSYLMRAGYLGEDYADYLGYFYEGALTPSDKELILALRRGVMPEVTAHVDNPQVLLEKLQGDELDEGRGIVISLIAYLSASFQRLDEPTRTAEQLADILHSGSLYHLERMAQATQQLLSRHDAAQFIQALHHFEPGLFRQMLEDTQTFLTAGPRQVFLRAILDNLEAHDLEQLVSDEQMSIIPILTDLEDVSLLIPGFETSQGAWVWLRFGPVCFGSLGEATAFLDLKKLIEWGCIKVNLEMLSLICRKAELEQSPTAAGPDSASEVVVSYRRIRALEIGELDGLLFTSTDLFVSELLRQTSTLDESPESLAVLLKAIAGHPELAERLLDQTDCEFEKITNVPEDLWGIVLGTDRVSAKDEAIWAFFEKRIMPDLKYRKDMDIVSVEEQIFDGFVNRHASDLKSRFWRKSSLDAPMQKYLLLSGVNNEVLKPLLEGVLLLDPSFLGPLLPMDRWEMLVGSKFLPYSTEIRDVVSANCARLEGQYLSSRWEAARGEVDLSRLSLETVITLSKSEAPSLSEKKQMWSHTTSSTLSGKPDAWSELARLCGVLNQHEDEFAKSFMPVLRALALKASVNSDQRSEILMQCLPLLPWPDVSDVLSLLSENDLQTLGPSVKKIQVSYSDINWRLMDALRRKGYLTSVIKANDKIKATTKPGGMKALGQV